jgi:hypothetical protein
MAQWFIPWFGQVQNLPTPRCGVPTDEGCNQPLSSGPKTHLNTTVFCFVYYIPLARNLHNLDFFPYLAKPAIADSEPLAHRTLSGAHRTVRCPLVTVGSATRHAQNPRSTVGPTDRWFTGQSGAAPDSPVNYSRTPLITSRER